MAADASSDQFDDLYDSDKEPLFSISDDDLYFSGEESLFPISDEEFAEALQFEEALVSSLLLTSITMAKTKRSEKPTSNKIQKPESSRSRSRSRSKTLCNICTDTKSAAEMFTSGLCSHSFCSDCISKHIAAKLEDSLAVKCPEPKCAAALEPEMCGSFVSKEVLERWGDALFDAMIMKMKKSYCPFEDCGAAMIDDGEEEEVTAVECPSCWRVFCAQCKVGWHGEMECVEFQKLRKKEGGGDRDDVMTMKLADVHKWKRCPYCRIYVDKIDGCLHITCRCGSEFCYSCGSKWSDNHAC